MTNARVDSSIEAMIIADAIKLVNSSLFNDLSSLQVELEKYNRLHIAAAVCKSLDTNVLQTILAHIGRRVVYAVVADSYRQIGQADSLRDYEREMLEPSKRWDNVNTSKAKNKKKGRVGDLFFFFHQNSRKNFCHLHRIENILPPVFRRAWWAKNEGHAARDVLMLSDQIGTPQKWINGIFLLLSSINNPDTGFKVTGWKGGTGVANWITGLDTVIAKELQTRAAQEENIFEYGSPVRIWTEDMDANFITNRKICDEAAEFMNAKSANSCYSNQQYGAALVNGMLLDEASHNRGICGADLQSGKTGIQVLVANSFRTAAIEHGKMTEDDILGVIHLQHISDKEIQNQTRNRFKASFGQQHFTKSEMYKSHHDSRTYLAFMMLTSNFADKSVQTFSEMKERGVTKFLIIGDEAHVGVNQNQQIAEFMSQLSVSTTMQSQNIWYLGVTATPRRYIPDSDGYQMTICWVDSGEKYYGLRQMVDNNQIRELGDFNAPDEIEDFVDTNLGDVNDQYVLLRVNPQRKIGKQSSTEVWQAVLESRGFFIHEINAAEGNIDTAVEIIDTPPSFHGHKRVALMIKGSLRAGVTLKSTKHIHSAVDCYKSQDAIIQSLVGRMCGYRDVNITTVWSSLYAVEDYLRTRDVLNGSQEAEQRYTKNNEFKTKPNYRIVCERDDSELCNQFRKKIHDLSGRKAAVNHIQARADRDEMALHLYNGSVVQVDRVYRLATSDSQKVNYTAIEQALVMTKFDGLSNISHVLFIHPDDIIGYGNKKVVDKPTTFLNQRKS